MLFMNSTTKNWIAWSIFFNNQPKNNFNIRCWPLYIWSKTKNRSKDYESIRTGVKRLTKLSLIRLSLLRVVFSGSCRFGPIPCMRNSCMRNSSYLLNDLRHFSETFRKDVTYDNIKSHKKTGFHPLFRRYIFRKSTWGVKLTPSRFRVHERNHCRKRFHGSQHFLLKFMYVKFFKISPAKVYLCKIF